MDNNVTKMLSARKIEGRKGIILGSHKELLYRIIAVNPVIQGFGNCFSYFVNGGVKMYHLAEQKCTTH
jgi:hypothetical protein